MFLDVADVAQKRRVSRSSKSAASTFDLCRMAERWRTSRPENERNAAG